MMTRPFHLLLVLAVLTGLLLGGWPQSGFDAPRSGAVEDPEVASQADTPRRESPDRECPDRNRLASLTDATAARPGLQVEPRADAVLKRLLAELIGLDVKTIPDWASPSLTALQLGWTSSSATPERMTPLRL